MLLGNLLTGKEKIRANESIFRARKHTTIAGEHTVRAGQCYWYHLILLQILKYKSIVWPKFNGVYSRNNLPKIKDGEYVMNLDEYKSVETHCMALYMNGKNIMYFDRCGVEYAPKGILKIIGNKNMITNICSIESWNNILVNLWNNDIVLFEVSKKIQKVKIQ